MASMSVPVKPKIAAESVVAAVTVVPSDRIEGVLCKSSDPTGDAIGDPNDPDDLPERDLSLDPIDMGRAILDRSFFLIGPPPTSGEDAPPLIPFPLVMYIVNRSSLSVRHADLREPDFETLRTGSPSRRAGGTGISLSECTNPSPPGLLPAPGSNCIDVAMGRIRNASWLRWLVYRARRWRQDALVTEDANR